MQVYSVCASGVKNNGTLMGGMRNIDEAKNRAPKESEIGVDVDSWLSQCLGPSGVFHKQC